MRQQQQQPVIVRAANSFVLQALELTSSMASKVRRWPLFTYLSGAIVCMCCSFVAHVFWCCSPTVAAIIWRFDYAGRDSTAGCRHHPDCRPLLTRSPPAPTAFP